MGDAVFLEAEMESEHANVVELHMFRYKRGLVVCDMFSVAWWVEQGLMLICFLN